MNKKLTALIACATVMAASGQAHAQDSVSIYGIIDMGVLYTTNANANGNGVFKMPSLTGTFPSRLGFKGAEDLGGGNQALFVLEAGFGPDSGVMGQGGRLFGRQSWVGLKGNWGQVSLGRQYAMTYIATQKTDVMGPNIISISSLDAYLPNARTDNAVGYIGNFEGITLGATYSFGRDASAAGGPAATNCAGEVAGDAKACRQLTGLLGYERREFGINTSYDVLRGGSGAAGSLSNSDAKDQRVGVNGYFFVGDLKFGLGVLNRRTDAVANVHTRSNLWYLGISYPLSAALILDAQVSRLDVKDSPNDVDLAVARLTYMLSKRTALYTSLGYLRNHGTSAVAIDSGGTVKAGSNQTGVMTGIRHTF